MAYNLFMANMFFSKNASTFFLPKRPMRDPNLKNMPQSFYKSKPFKRLIRLYDLFVQGNFSALDRIIKRRSFLTFRLLFTNLVYPSWITSIYTQLSSQPHINDDLMSDKLAHRLNIPAPLRRAFVTSLETRSLTSDGKRIAFNETFFQFISFKWPRGLKKVNYILRGLPRAAEAEAALFAISLHVRKISCNEARKQNTIIPMVDDQEMEFDEITPSDFINDEYATDLDGEGD